MATKAEPSGCYGELRGRVAPCDTWTLPSASDELAKIAMEYGQERLAAMLGALRQVAQAFRHRHMVGAVPVAH
jgi:hypothetical protein